MYITIPISKDYNIYETRGQWSDPVTNHSTGGPAFSKVQRAEPQQRAEQHLRPQWPAAAPKGASSAPSDMTAAESVHGMWNDMELDMELDGEGRNVELDRELEGKW